MDPVTPNIWQLQSRVDIDGLTAALRHADPEVRRKAAAALRALDAAQAIPALKDALARETDWEAQATLLAAVQYLTREDTLDVLIEQRNVEALVNLLFSDWTQDVLGAIEALGELGEKQATESLVVVFRSTELPDELRYAAAEALLRLQSAPAVVTLLAALRRDDCEVRCNAANMLGELHATWATRGLIDALEDPDEDVRGAARTALEKIGTPTAFKALESVEVAAPIVLETLETAVIEEPLTPVAAPPEDSPAEDELPPVEASAPEAEASIAAEPPVDDSPLEDELPPVEDAAPEDDTPVAAESSEDDSPAEDSPAVDDDPFATAELPSLSDRAAAAPTHQVQSLRPVRLEQDLADDPADNTGDYPGAAPERPGGHPFSARNAGLDDTVLYEPVLEDFFGDDEDDLDLSYDDEDDDEDDTRFYPVDVAF